MGERQVTDFEAGDDRGRVASCRDDQRLAIACLGQPRNLDHSTARIDNPVLRHAEAGHQVALSTPVVSRGGWREDFDGGIGREAHVRVEIDEGRGFRPKVDQIRLDDVVVGEHDVERRKEHRAARVRGVFVQGQEQPLRDDLMPWQR